MDALPLLQGKLTLRLAKAPLFLKEQKTEFHQNF